MSLDVAEFLKSSSNWNEDKFIVREYVKFLRDIW